MTLEMYASTHWKKHEKSLSKLSRSKSNNPNSNLIDSDLIAYDFDAIVKALFSANASCIRPKSADCMLIKDNNICFIEFKRFPRPSHSVSTSNISKHCQSCLNIVDQKLLKTLNTRDIHYSIKLKIVDTQIIALNELSSLIERETGDKVKLNAIFIIVVNNVAEDYMLNFLNERTTPTKSATKKAKRNARDSCDNKINILQMHTERYKRKYLPSGIYKTIKIFIPTELLSYSSNLWQLFDETN